MRQIHLRVTYRDDGTPFAAYLHLPSKPNEKRAKCRRVEPGMILDINKEGKLIGLELTSLGGVARVLGERYEHRHQRRGHESGEDQ